MKIIDYQVAAARGAEWNLQQVVKLLLKDGWQPQGGMSVCNETHPQEMHSGTTSVFYYQAMVKYAEPST